MNISEPFTMENGRPWWDVSEVKLGFTPVQLLNRVKELSSELRGLIFYSDSHEARQSMLEAVYALRSAEGNLAARSAVRSLTNQSQDERRTMEESLHLKIEKWDHRHWAVYDGPELICLTVYKKGALEVKRRLQCIIRSEVEATTSPSFVQPTLESTAALPCLH